MRKLAQRVEELLGQPVRSVEGLGGGDISEVFAILLERGDRVVAKLGPLVDVEAEMLRAIAAAGTPAPPVVACADGLMVMGHCRGRSGIGVAWDSLAEILTRQWSHQTSGDYGWDADYAFGSVTLPNSPSESWTRFWGGNRLGCHLPHLPDNLAGRIEALIARLGDHLPDRPGPDFLHGDLWGGNVLSEGSEITALIDPACCRGHREVDVAMLTLFDRPPERFFHALELEQGWEGRLPIYRLFPLLVHYRLFGEGYRPGIEAELAQVGC
ncbi:aminoglycoside phosphotransferase [Novosphingobium sp. PC22D]|uniref:fructosamine kinase family protein n=1 Tax=Novosphingobium sp. PC22D TaxID=1962403 RepID=UPI000BEFDC92|nr:fructosamine kinase family protein [Novosphingobium sp. PC22D]PEQ12788.1 aminoglycoside phosphotransferase [Novosphingobium sp. PC22D]